MRKLVVTRHSGLVEYLREEGLIGPDAEIVPHATVENVLGRHVIGVLPYPLAEYAASVTIIPLQIPPDLRGMELSVAQVRALAGAPRTYVVRAVED